jgi:hypothetical protein
MASLLMVSNKSVINSDMLKTVNLSRLSFSIGYIYVGIDHDTVNVEVVGKIEVAISVEGWFTRKLRDD